MQHLLASKESVPRAFCYITFFSKFFETIYQATQRQLLEEKSIKSCSKPRILQDERL